MFLFCAMTQGCDEMYRIACSIVAGLFCLLSVHDAAALNVTKKSMIGVAQAYGFLVSQDAYLDAVAEKFPDMQKAAKIAALEFEVTFPEVKKKIESELDNMGGSEGLRARSIDAKRQIRDAVFSGNFSRSDAQAFIEEVKGRANGNIYSPVLEYMLAVQYAKNPVGEFVDGFKQAYNTKDHAKAHGTRLRMNLPISWAAFDGDRPHIVQKWVSENGDGLNMITLVIKNADGFSPEKHEIESLVESGRIKDALEEGARYISAGTFTIEGIPGFWVMQDVRMERAGMTYMQRMLEYQFFPYGNFVQLTCHAGGVENARGIQAEFEKIAPLCRAVLNSFVLENPDE